MTLDKYERRLFWNGEFLEHLDKCARKLGYEDGVSLPAPWKNAKDSEWFDRKSDQYYMQGLSAKDAAYKMYDAFYRGTSDTKVL